MQISGEVAWGIILLYPAKIVNPIWVIYVATFVCMRRLFIPYRLSSYA